MNNFAEILERVKKVLNVEKDFEVAKIIGIAPNSFSNRKKSGSIPYSQFMTLANSYNLNLNWLFNGEGPIYKVEESRGTNCLLSIHEPADPEKITQEANRQKRDLSVSESKTLVVIEHVDLVKEYEDQETALRINKNLLLIEKKNKQAFRDMDHYVSGVVSGLKYSPDSEDEPDPEPTDSEQSHKTSKETEKKIN